MLAIGVCGAALSVTSADAANVSWSVNADGQWTTASNWSSGALPGAADAVTIDRPLGSYTITLSTGTQSISSLTCNENFSLAGGSLSLAGASTVSGSFTMTGGTVTGAGNLTLASASTWTGGTLAGAGSLLVAPASSLTVRSGSVLFRPILNSGTLTLDSPGLASQGQAAITNNASATLTKAGTGTTTLSLPFVNDGTVTVQQGSLSISPTFSQTLTSTGSFAVAAGAALTLGTNLSPAASVTGPGNVTVVGNVSLAGPVSAGSAAVYLGANATFGSSVTVDSLRMECVSATFNGPVTVAGTLANVEGVTAFNNAVSAGHYSLGHSVSFAAPMTFPDLSLSGRLALAADSTVTGPFTMTGNAALAGPGTLTAAGGLTLNGGTVGATSRLIIPVGTTLSLPNGTTPRQFDGAVDNAGTFDDVDGGNTNLVDIGSSDFTNAPGATFNLRRARITSSGTGRIKNDGAFNKLTASSTYLYPAFVNTGTLAVAGGTLNLYGGGTNSGTVTVSAAASLFIRGAWSSTPNSSITGPGTVNVDGTTSAATITASGLTGNLSLAGDVTVLDEIAPAFLLLSAGHFTFNGPFHPAAFQRSGTVRCTFNTDTTFTSLNLNPTETFDGSGDVTASGSVTCSGTLAGTGRLVIPAGGSFTLTNASFPAGSPPPLIARRIDTGGIFSAGTNTTSLYLAGGTFAQLGGASSVFNAGSLTTLAAPSYDPAAHAATTLFSNAGTVIKSSGAFLRTTVPFSNTGTLQISGGSFIIDGPFAQLSAGTLTAGKYYVSAPGRLDVTTAGPGGITTIGVGTSVTLSGAAASFPQLTSALSTIAGSLTLDNGQTFTPPGPLVNAGTLIINSTATLRLGGPFTNTGTILWALSNATIDGGAYPILWDYTGASSIGQIRGHLSARRITSTAADAAHRLAYIESALLSPEAARPLTGGIDADPTTVIVTLALTGDANLDGRVDADDLALIDRAFAKRKTGAAWTDGDFDYTGSITSADYLLIDRAFLAAQAPGFNLAALLARRESQFGDAYVAELLAAVPEPSSLFAACGLAIPLFARRRTAGA